MLFKRSTTKEVKEEVSPTFLERLDKVEQQIVQLKNENLDLFTTIDTMRNKILRKIQNRRDKEEPLMTVYKAGDSVPEGIKINGTN